MLVTADRSTDTRHRAAARPLDKVTSTAFRSNRRGRRAPDPDDRSSRSNAAITRRPAAVFVSAVTCTLRHRPVVSEPDPRRIPTARPLRELNDPMLTRADARRRFTTA
jgi:hypothetical protein